MAPSPPRKMAGLLWWIRRSRSCSGGKGKRPARNVSFSRLAQSGGRGLLAAAACCYVLASTAAGIFKAAECLWERNHLRRLVLGMVVGQLASNRPDKRGEGDGTHGGRSGGGHGVGAAPCWLDGGLRTVLRSSLRLRSTRAATNRIFFPGEFLGSTPWT